MNIQKAKRWMKGVLVGGLLVSMLAACGQGGGSGSGGNGDGGTAGTKTDDGQGAAPPANKEPVELVFYNASNSNATEEAFLKSNEAIEINKKFPNVKIKFVATGKGMTPQDVVASGQPIDVIICSVFSFTDLIETGLQYDISNLIKKNKYDMSRFEPTAIEFEKQFGDGGVFGFPITSTPTALFYNKDLFDKFGVAYPKDGMTWDETYELAKKMTRTDGGIQYRGFVTRYPFMYNVNQLSLSYLDPKTQKVHVTTDPFRLFMNNFTRFERIPGNEKSTTDMFIKDRKVAMMAYQLGRWGDLNWDAVRLPSYKEAMGVGPQPYSTYWNISSTSKHKDLAFEILSDLTSDEYQLKISKLGYLPVVKTPAVVKAFGEEADGSNNSKDLKGKHVQAFFYDKRANPTHVSPYDGIVAKKMNTAYSDIAAGKVDVVTALREVEEAANNEVDAAKK